MDIIYQTFNLAYKNSLAILLSLSLRMKQWKEQLQEQVTVKIS